MVNSGPFTGRPLVPPHLDVWMTDRDSEPVLYFASTLRRVKLEGRSVRLVHDHILPLLNGQHTVPDLLGLTAGLVAPETLEACLGFLHQHAVVVDAGDPASSPVQGEPPYPGVVHELGKDSRSPRFALSDRTVTVVGLSGAGATVASSLVAAGVGTLRLVDDRSITAADHASFASYCPDSRGRDRSEALADQLTRASGCTTVRRIPLSTTSDEALDEAVRGADFVVACLDDQQLAVAYRLNTLCLRRRVAWTSCSVTAVEALVGPTVRPHETACYHCFRVRRAAADPYPHDAADHETFLYAGGHDRGPTSETTAFSTGLVGQLAVNEAYAALTGLYDPPALGRLVAIDLRTLTSQRHPVLRRPRCPACSPSAGPTPIVTEPTAARDRVA